jgi:hypothetical protein
VTRNTCENMGNPDELQNGILAVLPLILSKEEGVVYSWQMKHENGSSLLMKVAEGILRVFKAHWNVF